MTGISSRWFLTFLAVCGLLLMLSITLVADDKTDDKSPPSLTLPTDIDLRKKFDAIDDYTRAEDWAEVSHLLQTLLDSGEDAFVPVTGRDDEGKERTRWLSVRGEANRLLAALPSAGRKAYDENYNAVARTRLEAALADHDLDKLTSVAVNYFYTTAGRNAMRLLAADRFERGDFVIAAICYDRLAAAAKADDPQPLWLGCLAHRLAGDQNSAEKAWKQLARQFPDGVKLAGRTLSLDDLQKDLDKQGSGSGAAQPGDSWPVYRGDAARCGTATGKDPGLEPSWQRQAFAEPAAAAWLQSDAPWWMIPAAAPIVVDGKLYWRTQHGIEAIDPHSGKRLWSSCQFRWGLDSIVNDDEAFIDFKPWLEYYLDRRTAFVENSVIGTLSSDGKLVYAVEDVPVPPVLTVQSNRGAPLSLTSALHSRTLTDALFHSRLLALNGKSGKLVWEIGRRSSATDKPGQATPLDDAYFLGPPLPLGRKLYAIIERHEEMRLVCLDPARGEVQWSQLLGSVRTHLMQDGGRRLFAAPIASQQGILICPTNCGTVVAVDLLSHGLLWAHSYPAKPFVEASSVGRRRSMISVHHDSLWKAAAPIIKGNNVIVAPVDGTSLECLDLQDGSLRWQLPNTENDLYVVAANPGVLVVGKKQCRLLDFADAHKIWSADTDPPTGLGSVVGESFYLPQKDGIAVVSLDNGEIVRKIPAGKEEFPGNLLWADGMVLSQTALRLSAYPQQEADREEDK